MPVYSFKNDYSEGAHPRILEALMSSNFEQTEGYGMDSHTHNAARLLKERMEREDVDVHFLVGGTQTNLTAIAAMLRPHHAVISASTGHICVHETGAIEATGHKAIAVPTSDGKLVPEMVVKVLEEHTDEHMVKPKIVYISNPAEIGTIYLKSELEALSSLCRQKGLILYMDGARLGCALTSDINDLTLSDIAGLVDAFYIGGTKSGALMGEALVICNDSLKEDFRFFITQRGGMLAKGRVLGIQFEELFRDDLYFELANHANDMAKQIKKALEELEVDMMTDSHTNQLFLTLPNTVVSQLEQKYSITIWGRADDDNTVIRLVTSWATREEAVSSLIENLKKLCASMN